MQDCKASLLHKRSRELGSYWLAIYWLIYLGTGAESLVHSFPALWNRASVLQTHNEDPLGLYSDADNVRHPLCASSRGTNNLMITWRKCLIYMCYQVTSRGTVLELKNKDICSCSGGHYAQRRNSSPLEFHHSYHQIFFTVSISHLPSPPSQFSQIYFHIF